MSNHYTRLLGDLKAQREAGDIDDAAFKRGAEELERQMNAELEKAQQQSAPAKPKEHTMSAQQVAVLVHRCNGADELEAVSARAHADRLGIDWRAA